MDLAAERTSLSGGLHGERVLVFSVDDGLFSLHLDWVEAVYEGGAVERHRVRDGKGPWHQLLLHRGEPALIVDLRDTFGLASLLGATERAAYVVFQSGGYRLALAIDQVSGVQDLELGSHPPVPSSLVRDGGIPVGHVVQHHDRLVVVLDPHRLISGAQRDALEPIWARAKAHAQREQQMAEVWSNLCKNPDHEQVRVFSRLCGRNGRAKAAAAARSVMKAMTDPSTGVQTHGTLPSLVDQLTAEVMRLAQSGATGAITVSDLEGGKAGTVFVSEGRVIDAQHESEWGRMAFKSLLTVPEGRVSFSERDLGHHPQRVPESSAALLISSLEAVVLEQRRRRAR